MLTKSLLDNREIVLVAISHAPGVYSYASARLRRDKSILKLALKKANPFLKLNDILAEPDKYVPADLKRRLEQQISGKLGDAQIKDVNNALDTLIAEDTHQKLKESTPNFHPPYLDI